MWSRKTCTCLSELGHDAHGFDLSPNSIHAAKERALELTLKCKFEVLDLRDLHKEEDYAGKFDIVTNLFTSFGYFPEERDHLSVVKGFGPSIKVRRNSNHGLFKSGVF